MYIYIYIYIYFFFFFFFGRGVSTGLYTRYEIVPMGTPPFGRKGGPSSRPPRLHPDLRPLPGHRRGPGRRDTGRRGRRELQAEPYTTCHMLYTIMCKYIYIYMYICVRHILYIHMYIIRSIMIWALFWGPVWLWKLPYS